MSVGLRRNDPFQMSYDDYTLMLFLNYNTNITFGYQNTRCTSTGVRTSIFMFIQKSKTKPMINKYCCFSTIKTVQLFTYTGIYLFYIYVKMKRTRDLEERAPAVYNIIIYEVFFWKTMILTLNHRWYLFLVNVYAEEWPEGWLYISS